MVRIGGLCLLDQPGASAKGVLFSALWALRAPRMELLETVSLLRIGGNYRSAQNRSGPLLEYMRRFSSDI